MHHTAILPCRRYVCLLFHREEEVRMDNVRLETRTHWRQGREVRRTVRVYDVTRLSDGRRYSLRSLKRFIRVV